jgi:endonuclease/exonuclease/phosphatase family metal-dependent hydrolase
MGDFNLKPSEPEIKKLDLRMKSTRKHAVKKDSHQTFNGWGKAKSDMIIDYIYYTGFASCLEYQTVIKKYSDRKFISDHYPIFARFIF